MILEVFRLRKRGRKRLKLTVFVTKSVFFFVVLAPKIPTVYGIQMTVCVKNLVYVPGKC